MTDYQRGKEESNKMRFGCFLTIAIVAVMLVIRTCNGDTGYKNSNRDDYDPSSVIDNPSKQ